jgi:hypothetical protein
MLCLPADLPAEGGVTPPSWTRPPSHTDSKRRETDEPATKYVTNVLRYAAEAADKIKVRIFFAYLDLFCENNINQRN